METQGRVGNEGPTTTDGGRREGKGIGDEEGKIVRGSICRTNVKLIPTPLIMIIVFAQRKTNLQ